MLIALHLHGEFLDFLPNVLVNVTLKLVGGQ